MELRGATKHHAKSYKKSRVVPYGKLSWAFTPQLELPTKLTQVLDQHKEYFELELRLSKVKLQNLTSPQLRKLKKQGPNNKLKMNSVKILTFTTRT